MRGHARGINSGIAGSGGGKKKKKKLFRKGRGLFQQYLHAGRVRFFGMKAVAAVNLEEIWSQTKCIHNGA